MGASVSTKQKILIVDDMPANIKFLSEALRPDYRVIAATSGAEALSIAASAAPPDIILLDIIMPEMNGYEVCKALKESEQTRDIPVIFITALGEEEDEAKGLELGAVDYITKPFKPAIVRARIGATLQLKEEMDARKKLLLELEQLNENLEHLVKERTLELEQANQQLMELDRMKTAFMTAVSHELRTPLTSVRGFSELTLRDFKSTFLPKGPARRKTDTVSMKIDNNLKVIVVESKRLQSLINNVILLTALDADMVDWDMEFVPAVDIVQDAVARVEDLATKKELEVKLDVEPELPMVFGDKSRLLQTMHNLLHNAVTFTEQGAVSITAKREKDTVLFQISDTGLGIDSETCPNIFNKFRQIGEILTDKPCGLGLGLPICKAIVEHHGGKIWFKSEQGRGSVFSFTLPLVVSQ